LILVSKFYEVQKYLTLDGHLYSIDFTFVNDPFFQKLPKDLRRIVEDAAKVSGTTHRGIQQYTSAIGVDELRQKGMEIYVPTPAEIEAFAKATQPRVTEWLSRRFRRSGLIISSKRSRKPGQNSTVKIEFSTPATQAGFKFPKCG